MKRIFVKPSELWGYCEELLEDDGLGEYMYKIAENEEYGISVWVEMCLISAYIIVELDDVEVYKAHIYDEDDAELTADWIYSEFLDYEEALDDGVCGEDYNEVVMAQKIEDREFELDCAFIDLLKSITDDVSNLLVEDVKEHTLEYLAKEWGIDLYRPSIVVDEDSGEEYYTEFPYENMLYA